ncbi:MAG: DeoR/GlpR transcriptional regulator [Clostridia bacterium]|nr:DeoR/GlpR transcriptional regulator [Clostridia bacterium]
MKEKIEQEILSILQVKQFLTVNELASALFVSTATVRRKLTTLQEKGLVIRTHGGAQLNDANNLAPNFDLRVHTNSLAKRKIALSALKLIKNGDLIFLDGSTSSYLVAEYLKEFSDIRVLTNGVDTLSLLAKNGVLGYSTGGAISSDNKSTLVGQLAIETTKKMHANIAFFSAQSIDSNGNIYDCYEQENYLRKTMMENADVKVFLCDDKKVDRRSPFFLCNISSIDYVITNANLKEFFKGKFDNKIILV